MLSELTRRRALKLLGIANAVGLGSLSSSLGAAIPSTDGSGWTQLTKLIAEDSGSDNWFGRSIALNGDTAIIGAVNEAHVFTASTGNWSQQAKLTAPPKDNADSFGESVGLDGATALVGAPNDNDESQIEQQLADLGYKGHDAGSAYAFTYSDDEWACQTQLTAPDGDRDRGDRFGSSVAIDDNTALIGADAGGGPGGSNKTGAAYVFTHTNGDWTRNTKLTPSDENAEFFGWSVALDGDTAIIGARMSDLATGSAYAFTCSDGSWAQEAKLTADDGDSVDRFGWSVDVDGDTAIIGAERDEDPNGEGAGSAYVFTCANGDWTQEAKLAADDGDAQDSFGSSAAIDGDTIFVGANGDEDPNGDNAGAAYVFTRAGGEWVQQTKLAADNGDSFDNFGESIALENRTALIGAAGNEDPLGYAAGSTYVYWKEQRKVTIDVKPGSDITPINSESRGVVPVAIIHTNNFNPTTRIDVSSLRFGAPDVIDNGGGATPVHGGHVEDVDGDGADDLVLHFPVEETEITGSDTAGKLVGETTDGAAIFGMGSVT